MRRVKDWQRWTDSQLFYYGFVLEPTRNPLSGDPVTRHQESLPGNMREVQAASFFPVWGTLGGVWGLAIDRGRLCGENEPIRAGC